MDKSAVSIQKKPRQIYTNETPDTIDIDGDHVSNIFNMIHTAPLIRMTEEKAWG